MPPPTLRSQPKQKSVLLSWYQFSDFAHVGKIESFGETWRDLPHLYSHWGCLADLRRCGVAFEMRLLCSLVFVFLQSYLQVFDSVRNKGPR